MLSVERVMKKSFNGTRILTESKYEEMWEPHTGAGDGGHGLGWSIEAIGEHRVVGHGGADIGFNSKLLLAPEEGIAIIAMTNWLDSFDGPFIAIEMATDVMHELLCVEN